LEIKENLDLRVQLLEYLTKEYQVRWRRPSSLAVCTGKSYYRAIDIKPVIAPSENLRLVIGKVGHAVLQVLPSKEITLEKDGIIGHADMLGERYAEIKITWMSSNRPVEDMTQWIKQIKAYAYMAGVTEYDLVVLHIMGNWKFPVQPGMKVYTLKFTEEELKENWNSMLIKLKIIDEAVKTHVLPLLDPEDWECDRCSYAYHCLGEVKAIEFGDVRIVEPKEHFE
jgi:CRISPR/Cas system-associated exonuclease Cas4 (RecB family)